jgi:Ran GTPase-activating protein (RanGAP) involved in mRNA processing and transport
MEGSEYVQLLALAQHARLAPVDARRLEIEAERRQDLRGYFTALLRQGRSDDLRRVAYEIASTRSAERVADALSQLPPETPVWTALLTASSVFSEVDHDLVARNIERWPTSVRVAPASWFGDLQSAHPPRYWRWVRAAKLLREDEGKLAQVLASEAMRSVQLLDLSHNDLGDGGITRVATSACLGGLQELLLTGVGCMDEGAMALAEAPRMPQLRVLVLSRNDIDARGAARLIAINRLTALHTIDLSVNPLDGEELARELYGLAPRPGGLKLLNLEDNGLGASALAELAKLPHFAEIERLALSGNDFGVTGIEALTTRRLQYLRSLTLGGSGLGDPGVAALVEAPWLPRLRDLDLSDNHIGNDGLATLLRKGRLSGLEVLQLSRNDISDRGAALLEHHTGLSGLRELDISHNAITGVGASALVANPALGWLESLDLTGTCADGSGDALATALSRADHMRSLESLRLPPVGPAGVAALAAAENISSLRRLEVRGLGHEGLERLRASRSLLTCEVVG